MVVSEIDGHCGDGPLPPGAGLSGVNVTDGALLCDPPLCDPLPLDGGGGACGTWSTSQGPG